MAYRKCKVYYDGSHYIGIPPQPRKPRPKKGSKVKKEVPELEELDEEDEDCPFDKPVQLSLFDEEKREEALPESPSADETGQETVQSGETAASPSRKEIFDILRLYKRLVQCLQNRCILKLPLRLLPAVLSHHRVAAYRVKIHSKRALRLLLSDNRRIASY